MFHYAIMLIFLSKISQKYVIFKYFKILLGVFQRTKTLDILNFLMNGLFSFIRLILNLFICFYNIL